MRCVVIAGVLIVAAWTCCDIFAQESCSRQGAESSFAQKDPERCFMEYFRWIVAPKELGERGKRLDFFLRRIRRNFLSAKVLNEILMMKLHEWSRLNPGEEVFYRYAVGRIYDENNFSASVGIPWLEKARDAAPRQALPRIAIARYYENRLDWIQAMPVYEELLSGAYSPGDKERAVVFFLTIGETDQVAEWTDYFIKHPKELADPGNFARGLIMERRYAEAKHVLAGHLRDGNPDQELLYHAGCAEMFLGNTKEAVSLLTRCFLLPDSFPKSLHMQNVEWNKNLAPLDEFFLFYRSMSRFFSGTDDFHLLYSKMYRDMQPSRNDWKLPAMYLLNRILNRPENAAEKTAVLNRLREASVCQPEFLLADCSGALSMADALMKLRGQNLREDVMEFLLACNYKSSSPAGFRRAADLILKSGSRQLIFYQLGWQSNLSDAEKLAFIREYRKDLRKLPPDQCAAFFQEGVTRLKSCGAMAEVIRVVKEDPGVILGNPQMKTVLPKLLNAMLKEDQYDAALAVLKLINDFPAGQEDVVAGRAEAFVIGDIQYMQSQRPYTELLNNAELIAPKKQSRKIKNVYSMTRYLCDFPPTVLDGVFVHLSNPYDRSSREKMLPKMEKLLRMASSLELKPMLRLMLLKIAGEKEDAVKMARLLAAEPNLSSRRGLNLAAFFLSYGMDDDAYRILVRIMEGTDGSKSERNLAAMLILLNAYVEREVPETLLTKSAVFLSQNMTELAERHMLAKSFHALPEPWNGKFTLPEFAVDAPDFNLRNLFTIPADAFTLFHRDMSRGPEAFRKDLPTFLRQMYQQTKFSRNRNNRNQLESHCAGIPNAVRKFSKDLPVSEIVSIVTSQKNLPPHVLDFELAFTYDLFAGDSGKALELYRKLSGRDPGNVFYLGRLFKLSLPSDPDAALRYYNALRGVVPNYDLEFTVDQMESMILLIDHALKKSSDDPNSPAYISAMDFRLFLNAVVRINGHTDAGYLDTMFTENLSGRGLRLNTALYSKREDFYKKMCAFGAVRPHLAREALNAKLRFWKGGAEREFFEDAKKIFLLPQDIYFTPWMLMTPFQAALTYLLEHKNIDEVKALYGKIPEQNSMNRDAVAELIDCYDKVNSGEIEKVTAFLKEDMPTYHYYKTQMRYKRNETVVSHQIRHGNESDFFLLLENVPGYVNHDVEADFIKKSLASGDHESVKKYIRIRLATPRVKDGTMNYYANRYGLLTPFRTYSLAPPFASLAIREILAISSSETCAVSPKLLSEMLSTQVSGNPRDLNCALMFQNTVFFKEFEQFDCFLSPDSLRNLFDFLRQSDTSAFRRELEKQPRKTFGVRFLLTMLRADGRSDFTEFLKSELPNLEKADGAKVVRLTELGAVFARVPVNDYLERTVKRKSPELYALLKRKNVEQERKLYQELTTCSPVNLGEYNQRVLTLFESIWITEPELAHSLLIHAQKVNRDRKNEYYFQGIFKVLLWNRFLPVLARSTADGLRSGKPLPISVIELAVGQLTERYEVQEGLRNGFFPAAFVTFLTAGKTEEAKRLAALGKRFGEMDLTRMRNLLTYASPEHMLAFAEQSNLRFLPMPDVKKITPMTVSEVRKLDALIALAKQRSDRRTALFFALMKESDPFGPDGEEDYVSHVPGILKLLEQSGFSAGDRKQIVESLNANCRDCASELEEKQ